MIRHTKSGVIIKNSLLVFLFRVYMDIITREPVYVNVSEIQFDDSNPNKMEREQIEALKTSLLKYGNVQPVILDSDTKQIADGQHRVIAYSELGLEQVPAIIMKFDNDNERRMLRQVMNKLHGKHDPELDIAELEVLMSYDDTALQQLLQVDKDVLEDLIRINREEQAMIGTLTTSVPTVRKEGETLEDAPTLEHHAETYIKGNIKQITLYFNNEEYLAVMPRIEAAMKHFNLQNNTELFIRLLDHWESQSLVVGAEAEATTG